MEDKMTKQQIEQIEKMAQAMCGFCAVDKRCVLKYSAPCSDIASQDCTYKESAEELIHKGYGDISEYKAEIANLKADFDSLQESYEFVRDCDAEHCLEINETVKQAKIDVLNEVKKCSRCDNFFPDGKWHRYVLVSDIDILIEEVENGKDIG